MLAWIFRLSLWGSLLLLGCSDDAFVNRQRPVTPVAATQGQLFFEEGGELQRLSLGDEHTEAMGVIQAGTPVVSDAAHVYWRGPEGLVRAPVEAGSGTPLPLNPPLRGPEDRMADDAESLLWLNGSFVDSCDLHRVPKEGGEASLLAQGIQCGSVATSEGRRFLGGTEGVRELTGAGLFEPLHDSRLLDEGWLASAGGTLIWVEDRARLVLAPLDGRPLHRVELSPEVETPMNYLLVAGRVFLTDYGLGVWMYELRSQELTQKVDGDCLVSFTANEDGLFYVCDDAPGEIRRVPL